MDRKEIKSKARQVLGGSYFSNQWLMGILLFLVMAVIAGISSAVVIGPVILSGPLSYGIMKAFLKNARDGKSVDISDIFDGFKNDFADNIILGVMISLFTMLWSFLFIIPGIIKSISYSMAYFIKADNPEYKWRRCIEESEKMTKGHIGEIFVLYLSFIPFAFVGMLCLGLGTLWLVPYMNASLSQVYLKLSASQYVDTAAV